MQIVRDLVRDLVGIIFPGGLIVAFTLWFFWAVVIIIDPSTSLTLFPTDNNILILLIFSYIAGQSLRIKRLDALEERCTEEYRKQKLPSLDESEWKKHIQNIKEEEEKYFAGNSSLDRLKHVYREYSDKFKFWEKFPYGYRLRGRRLLHQPENYIKFFKKYDKQGITKFETFFNLCKSVVYEYSPSFKEELLRQESLVRLFTGIYYVIKYGKVLAIISGILHLSIAIATGLHWSIVNFLKYDNTQLSLKVFSVSLFAFLIFLYMNNEIINRIRHMRVKEVNLAHDAFYLISTKCKLDL